MNALESRADNINLNVFLPVIPASDVGVEDAKPRRDRGIGAGGYSNGEAQGTSRNHDDGYGNAYGEELESDSVSLDHSIDAADTPRKEVLEEDLGLARSDIKRCHEQDKAGPNCSENEYVTEGGRYGVDAAENNDTTNGRGGFGGGGAAGANSAELEGHCQEANRVSQKREVEDCGVADHDVDLAARCQQCICEDGEDIASEAALSRCYPHRCPQRRREGEGTTDSTVDDEGGLGEKCNKYGFLAEEGIDPDCQDDDGDGDGTVGNTVAGANAEREGYSQQGNGDRDSAGHNLNLARRPQGTGADGGDNTTPSEDPASINGSTSASPAAPAFAPLLSADNSRTSAASSSTSSSSTGAVVLTPTTSQISVPVTAPAGAIVLTQPPQTLATCLYRISPPGSGGSASLVTFGWNMTDVLVMPTHLTVQAVCDNGFTYAVGGPTGGGGGRGGGSSSAPGLELARVTGSGGRWSNGNSNTPNAAHTGDGIIPADQSQVVWDVYGYQAAHPATPFPQGLCSLRIGDERGFAAARRPGYLSPNSALTFALYTGEAYAPLAKGEACANCKPSFNLSNAAGTHPLVVSVAISVSICLLSGLGLLRSASCAGAARRHQLGHSVRIGEAQARSKMDTANGNLDSWASAAVAIGTATRANTKKNRRRKSKVSTSATITAR